MKIVYATRAAIPSTSAASWNIVQHCDAFAASGLDVTLFAAWKAWRRNTQSSDIYTFYGLPTSFKLRRGFDLPKVESIFNRQVIYALDGDTLLYSRSIHLCELAVSSNRDCILELHHLPSQKEIERIESISHSLRLHSVVAISHALAHDLTHARGIHHLSTKLTVAPDAVDVDRIIPQSLAEQSFNPTCGYVGSMHRGKGVDLISTLALAAPHIRFVLHGGSTDDFLKVTGSEIIPSNVCITGSFQPSHLHHKLNTFDIALLPNSPNVLMPNGVNIGAYTSPMKMFEYMAAGKAIVASDLSILREVLIHGHNAILVPHNDPLAWVEAIDTLVDDSDLRCRLMRNARRDAVERYSFHSRIETILRRRVA